MSTELIVAAGCLVTRGSGDDAEVLLVHRPKYDDWSLPKGKQDAGEHTTETAVREVLEESGVQVALRQPLTQREYKLNGQPKLVHYWRAEVVNDKGFVPNREVDEILWLPAADAGARATHPLDGELIRRASDQPSVPFLVLRHAHAAKRAAWAGDDVDRPLDPDGVGQADALVPRLAAYGLERVHTSAARRCVQTVCPYADSHDLAVITEPELTELAYLEAPETTKARIAALATDALRRGEATLLCGHRPYLPDVIDHLLEGSGLTGPRDTVPVGSMIILHLAPQSQSAPQPDSAPQREPHHVIALEHHLL